VLSNKDKVLYTFLNFPESHNFLIKSQEDLGLRTAGFKLDYRFSTSASLVSLSIENIGTFEKYWEVVSKSYIYAFNVGEYTTAFSNRFNKEESDIFCRRALPFMLSYGKDKSTIPLLINDFPDFARFAIRYIPKDCL